MAELDGSDLKRRSSRISAKLLAPDPEPDPPKAAPMKKAKSASQRNKEYRAHILADPFQALQYKEANKHRSKAYRDNASAEQKAKMNEGARVRNAAYRKRKKEEIENNSKTSTRQLSKSKEEHRKKAAESKRRWRASRTPQKKMWDNKKRRDKRAEEKALEQSAPQSAPACLQLSPDKRTPVAKRKALQRIRAVMPKSPTKYAATVHHLQTKASPNKKAALEQRGLTQNVETAKVGHFVLQMTNELSNRKDLPSRKARKLILSIYEKYGSIRRRSKILRMNRKTVASHSKPKELQRKKKMQETCEEIKGFFDDAAVPLPDKKLVSKKTGKSQGQLRKPLTNHFDDYKESGGKASFSMFAKCRPKHIRKLSSARLNQCLCEYCENVNLKIKEVNRIAPRHCRIRHIFHAVSLSTCRDKKKDCAYRECSECGITQLEEFLTPITQHTRPVTWHRWSGKTVQKGGQSATRKILESRKGKADDLVKELCDEVEFLSQHLFRAEWQHKQFQSMKSQNPFPPHQLVCVMDFAENFACFYQEEVQSAHWHHESVTIHPVTVYKKCPHCQEAQTESLIFVSDDMKHDHHMVHAVVDKTMKHFADLPLTKVIQWSDGCGAQYKSKGPFADLAASEVDFGIPFQRCYFGSRHGKSPCDGEAAVVKSHVTRAVTASDGSLSINNAAAFFEYCQSSKLTIDQTEEKCCHFLRKFVWLPKDAINRSRAEREVKTVKGTRNLHQVRSSVNGKTLFARHLTCTCAGCTADFGKCDFTEIVGSWQQHSLLPLNQSASTAQRQPPSDNLVSVQRAPTPQNPSISDQSSSDLPAQSALPASDQPAVATPAQPLPASDLPASATPAQPLPASDLPASATPAQPLPGSDLPASATPTQPLPDTDLPASATSGNPVSASATPAHPLPASATPAQPLPASNLPASATPAQPLPVSATPAQPLPASDQPAVATPAHPLPVSRVTTERPTMKIGDFVRVNVLPASGNLARARTFHGMIDQLDAGGDGVVVRFLKRTGHYFVWPNIEDRAFVFNTEIVAMLSAPTIDGRGRHVFE